MRTINDLIIHKIRSLYLHSVTQKNLFSIYWISSGMNVRTEETKFMYGFYSRSNPQIFGGVTGGGFSVLLTANTPLAITVPNKLPTSNIKYVDNQITIPFNGRYQINYHYCASFATNVTLQSMLYADDTILMGSETTTNGTIQITTSASCTVADLVAGQRLVLYVTSDNNTTMSLRNATISIIKVD